MTFEPTGLNDDDETDDDSTDTGPSPVACFAASRLLPRLN